MTTEATARAWCRKYGYEFRSWDGIFCAYRDPRRAGTMHEYGLESWIG